MFKLPNAPSAQASTHELADFAELLAWCQGSASTREIIAWLGQLDENDDPANREEVDSGHDTELDEVINEIDRRRHACASGYPFALDRSGTVLRYVHLPDDHRADVYRYLLLATRLNMDSNKMHAEIDGTKLLEELAARVLQCYLGLGRAKSMVFGTANDVSFWQKIERLCKALGEGHGFRNLDAGAVHAKDDKLDTVSWVPFSDGKPGQLIIFGQCKTGTHWRDRVSQLNPDAFVKSWIDGTIALTPVRAFCIAEAADRSRWTRDALYAGLLFDRCRLVDFCDSLDPDLHDRIRHWNKAACNSVRLG